MKDPSSDFDIEQLIDQYAEELKRFVYTYIKNWATAEDVTQEVFLKAYEKLDTFKGESTIRTWLFSIAANRSKDYLRTWHYKNLLFKTRLEEPVDSDSNYPEQVVILSSEASELIEKVMLLPVKYREVLLLYYYKEMSVEEIHNILDIPISTVKTRLKRAREKLKPIISDLSHEEGYV
ncbi:sigma-70 family RNA polymerase sigma factor [Bacillaceae bacterium S4-13-56]